MPVVPFVTIACSSQKTYLIFFSFIRNPQGFILGLFFIDGFSLWVFIGFFTQDYSHSIKDLFIWLLIAALPVMVVILTTSWAMGYAGDAEGVFGFVFTGILTVAYCTILFFILEFRFGVSSRIQNIKIVSSFLLSRFAILIIIKLFIQAAIHG